MNTEGNNIENTISLEHQPNYDFLKTREITVANFYKTMFVQFALYRARQRIPKIDGLAETQRKFLWAMIKGANTSKKNKVSSLFALVLKYSNYHHGEASLYNVINNLVAYYKNNLTLFKEDGNFGSRYLREACAPRYVETRNSNTLKLLFNEEDIIATFGYRKLDGQDAEPDTLYPILPLGIIMGQTQTAVGFATNILPRKTETILDLFIDILSGKSNTLPNYIEPSWPYYYGKVQMIDPNTWESLGVVRKVQVKSKTLIKIVEVPYNWDKYKLIEVLEALKDSGKITSYLNDSKSNTFDVTIVAPDLIKFTEEELIYKLGLTSSVTESFVYYTNDDKFEVRCNTISQYLQYFIKERIKVYTLRKKYLLEKLLFEMYKILATINYINEINAGRIEIRNVDEEVIIEKLKSYPENYNFRPSFKKFKYVPENVKSMLEKDMSFDYLFDFPVRNLTPKMVLKLRENYAEMSKTYTELYNKTESQMWLDDLLEFKKGYNK